MRAVVSDSDPFFLTEIDGSRHGYHVTDGLLPFDMKNTFEKKTAAIIWAGESVFGNYDDTLYSANDPLIGMMDVYSGAVYQAKDPQIGAQSNGGSMTSRTAVKLKSAGTFGCIINQVLNVGGTKIADWNNPGVLGGRVDVAKRRFAAYGLTPITCHMFGVMNIGGNDSPTTLDSAAQIVFQNRLIAFFNKNGQDIPWFLPTTSWVNGSANGFIQAGAANVRNNVNILDGGNIDVVNGSTMRETVFNTHFKAAGSDAASTIVQQQITLFSNRL